MKLIDKIKNLPIITIAVPLLVLCFIFYFIFFLALKQYTALSKNIKNRKVDLTMTQSLNKQYAILKEDIKKKKSELDELKNRLFWEKDISKFLDELTRLASHSDIEFVSLKPQIPPPDSLKEDKTTDKEFYDILLSEVHFAVSLKSSYNNIIGFLKKIEESDKFIKINSINIEAQPGSIFKHSVNMKLSILIS